MSTYACIARFTPAAEADPEILEYGCRMSLQGVIARELGEAAAVLYDYGLRYERLPVQEDPEVVRYRVWAETAEDL